MALFKIFNNFDNPDHTLPTSTHKGYCYFDVKTKLFWIDIADSNGVTLTSENISNYRVPLNANLAAAAGLLVNENGEWSSVPEKTSDLVNDSGFLTSFTETDPTVPSWAKASTKPTYTASEIQGALTSFYLDQPKIPEPGPYPNIQLALGSSYSIKDQNNGTIQNFIMPSVPTWALAENKPTYTATEVGALPSNTTYVSSVNGQSGAVTITDSDEKVKHTDLNGTNSGKPVLLAATMLSNGSSRTETVYSSTKLMWNDYSPNLSIYNSDRSKYSSISATRIGLANSSTAYTGALSLSTLSSDRTYTLPNKSGTIALTTDIPTAVTESTVSGWGFTKNTGTITGVSVNGTSVATSGVANITSIPASILSGEIPSDVTATTQDSSDNSEKIATTAFVKNNLGGLSGAMHFKGTTTTALTDGTTTAAVTINNSSYTPSAGDVVLYGNKEFVWTGSLWELLGDEGSYKVKQSAVSSPTANGNTTAFIDTISQDANGVITVTKKNLDTSGTWSGNATTATTATKLGSTDVGSATKPIYLDSGTATECSTYAGGTAVTLNNSSKAASTASFYAPTTGGTQNTQALIGNGATAAPKWVNISPSVTVTAGTASAAPKINVTVLGQSGTAQSITTATTGLYGVTKLNSATNSTSTSEAATPSAVKSAYDLANNHKYWANIEATSAATYNKAPEMATIKLNGNTSASAASTSNVTLVFDTVLQALNFVFV